MNKSEIQAMKKERKEKLKDLKDRKKMAVFLNRVNKLRHGEDMEKTCKKLGEQLMKFKTKNGVKHGFAVILDKQNISVDLDSL